MSTPPAPSPDVVTFQWTRQGRPVGRPLAAAWPRAAAEPAVEFLRAPPAVARGLGLEIRLPIQSIAGIWMPYGDRATLQKVVWRGRTLGTPFYLPGLIAWVDIELRNRLALLTEPDTAEVEITWALDQAGAAYHIRIAWQDQPGAAARGLRFCTAGAGVHDVAARLLRASSAGLTARATAPTSFEPSYCTWYAYHGAIDQRSADACARLCRDLGFGAFIMDDGWAYDAVQRVGPTLGPWHRYNGDFTPARLKFPDFAEHIAGVKALGLRYILWIAPFMIGVKSRAFRKLRPHLLPAWLDEGFRTIDPRCKEAVDYIVAALTRLLETYPVDGFKVDYDYALLAPGQKPQGVGAAYAAAVRRILAALKRINPALEWNLMANAFSRRVTAAFRCIDVPFDPESNRLIMANAAPLAETAALYSDPALWSPRDSLMTVHRHLAPALFIVPSVGAPLLELPAPHRDAIRQWLGFYRRHQALLNHGRFEADWQAGDFQSFTRRQGARCIVAAFSGYPVKLAPGADTRIIHAGTEAALLLDLDRRAWVTPERPDGRALSRTRPLARGLQRVACAPGTVLRIAT